MGDAHYHNQRGSSEEGGKPRYSRENPYDEFAEFSERPHDCHCAGRSRFPSLRSNPVRHCVQVTDDGFRLAFHQENKYGVQEYAESAEKGQEYEDNPDPERVDPEFFCYARADSEKYRFVSVSAPGAR